MLVHEIINRGQENDIAIVDEGRQITYSQLRAGIKNIAIAFINREFSRREIFEYMTYRKSLAPKGA